MPSPDREAGPTTEASFAIGASIPHDDSSRGGAGALMSSGDSQRGRIVDPHQPRHQLAIRGAVGGSAAVEGERAATGELAELLPIRTADHGRAFRKVEFDRGRQ